MNIEANSHPHSTQAKLNTQTVTEKGLSFLGWIAKSLVDHTPIQAEDRLLRVAGVCFAFMI